MSRMVEIEVTDDVYELLFSDEFGSEGDTADQRLSRTLDMAEEFVNGGGMLGHWRGVKLYHLVCKASEKVRANWPA